MELCYVLPPTNNIPTTLDETEIVVPHALQMGWSESPPFFCAATETARDIIQQQAENHTHLPSHQLEHFLLPKNTNNKENTTNAHIQIEVYVDDFIAITNNPSQNNLEHWSRAILHGIHTVFPPPSITKHSGGDPISEKKLLQQEGLWHTEKEILGWILNGKNFTIQLPTKKATKIKTILKQMARENKVPLQEFQKLAGNLVHASIGIPKGQGLLSDINKGLQQPTENIKITPAIKQALTDWRFLIQIIESRPTSILELTPGQPWFIGYTDASGKGVGGVWTDGTKHLPQPIVWRCKWPQDISKNLVSQENPKGTITINDLELAGELLAWLVLEHISPIHLQHAHIGIHCDNTASVAWTNKLNSSSSIIAGQLLKALATRQYLHRTSPLLTVSIQGENNTMADVASRSYTNKNFTNSNKTFLQNFNLMFPLQNNSWKEFHLSPKLFSRVTSCLRGEQSTMASWLKIPKQERNIGLTGKPTQTSSEKTPSSQTAQTVSRSSSPLLLLQGSGQVTTEKDSKSQFKQSLKRNQPSQRPVNWLENRPLSFKQRKLTKYQWHGWLKGSEDKIHQPHHN